MRTLVLTLLTAGMASILLAGSVDLAGTTNTISFNPVNVPPTITLGANNCGTTCVFTGTQAIETLTLTWAFTMPNDSVSPFFYSYSGGSGTVFTNGSPALLFNAMDTSGDSASGTFGLSTLNTDGASGVDLNGAITITSLVIGGQATSLEALLGLPPSTTPDVVIPFVLDVGDCTHGSRAVACVTNTPAADPSAQFLSLTLTTTPGTTTPEPGTFAMLGVALTAVFAIRKRAQQ